jgi:arsenate reductase-like glutaredoxin family protein
VLDERGSTIVSERNSRREPLTDAEARKLLKQVGRVIVARGRKVETLDAGRARVADLKGPTGNYRAPMLRRGKTLLVGFNAEALQELV